MLHEKALGKSERRRWLLASLSFHEEGHGYDVNAFAGFHHVLCGSRVFLEMRCFEMRLKGICVGVDFKKADVTRIDLERAC